MSIIIERMTDTEIQLLLRATNAAEESIGDITRRMTENPSDYTDTLYDEASVVCKAFYALNDLACKLYDEQDRREAIKKAKEKPE